MALAAVDQYPMNFTICFPVDPIGAQAGPRAASAAVGIVAVGAVHAKGLLSRYHVLRGLRQGIGLRAHGRRHQGAPGAWLVSAVAAAGS